MSNKDRSVSIGFIIGVGFVVLGMLNLFATEYYRKTAISSTSRIPGILFILTGIIIIIIRTIKKPGE
jgi:hypothetical protein